MTRKAAIPLNALKQPNRNDRRRSAIIAIVVVLALALLATACGTDSESTTATAGAPGEQGASGQHGHLGGPVLQAVSPEDDHWSSRERPWMLTPTS